MIEYSTNILIAFWICITFIIQYKPNKDIVKLYNTNIFSILMLSAGFIIFIFISIFGIANLFSIFNQWSKADTSETINVLLLLMAILISIACMYPLISAIIKQLKRDTSYRDQYKLYKPDKSDFRYIFLDAITKNISKSMLLNCSIKIYFSEINSLSPFIVKNSNSKYDLIFPNNIFDMVSRVTSTAIKVHKDADEWLIEYIVRHELSHIMNRDDKLISVLNNWSSITSSLPIIFLLTLLLYFLPDELLFNQSACLASEPVGQGQVFS